VVNVENLLARYATWIRELPDGRPLTAADLLTRQFLLHRDGALEIYYAPFDHVNTRARIVIVGITPGWAQMEIAYRTARHLLRDGLTLDEASRQAKQQASFAGQIRRNLVDMLNGLELPAALGIESSASLFDDRADLLHTSSAIRYPVFVNGQNYTGHTPPLLRTPLLCSYIDQVLGPELAQLPHALVVPCGGAVSAALGRLIRTGTLDARRCLLGFPHPSGANGHRLKHYDQARSTLRDQVAAWAARRASSG
jgi:hypothetical protein